MFRDFGKKMNSAISSAAWKKLRLIDGALFIVLLKIILADHLKNQTPYQWVELWPNL
jgi:hypothetical protein